MIDTVEILTGVSITLVTPALVEVAKRMGMPVKYAGLAAMAFAIALITLGDLADGIDPSGAGVARWIMSGIVYGLAAVGLYSQAKLPGPPAMS